MGSPMPEMPSQLDAGEGFAPDSSGEVNVFELFDIEARQQALEAELQIADYMAGQIGRLTVPTQLEIEEFFGTENVIEGASIKLDYIDMSFMTEAPTATTQSQAVGVIHSPVKGGISRLIDRKEEGSSARAQRLKDKRTAATVTPQSVAGEQSPARPQRKRRDFIDQHPRAIYPKVESTPEQREALEIAMQRRQLGFPAGTLAVVKAA